MSVFVWASREVIGPERSSYFTSSHRYSGHFKHLEIADAGNLIQKREKSWKHSAGQTGSAKGDIELFQVEDHSSAILAFIVVHLLTYRGTALSAYKFNR